jgi:hypothetical protein
MVLKPISQRYNIDALLCLDADDGKVDRVDELRGGAVVDPHDGASAANGPGIDAKN